MIISQYSDSARFFFNKPTIYCETCETLDIDIYFHSDIMTKKNGKMRTNSSVFDVYVHFILCDVWMKMGIQLLYKVHDEKWSVDPPKHMYIYMYYTCC